MKNWIDLGIGKAYPLGAYLKSRHIACDIRPVINGEIVEEPDWTGDWSEYTNTWRVIYDDSPNQTVTKLIRKWIEMKRYGLRPCPFCGGIATVDRCSVTTDEIIITWTSYTVECWECGCKTAPGVTEQDVIDVWNRRA